MGFNMVLAIAEPIKGEFTEETCGLTNSHDES